MAFWLFRLIGLGFVPVIFGVLFLRVALGIKKNPMPTDLDYTRDFDAVKRRSRFMGPIFLVIGFYNILYAVSNHPR